MLFRSVINKNLAVAREALDKIAQNDFNTSYQTRKKLDKKVARPVRAIANIYKKYFDVMQNRGWEVISPKPQINKPTKLYLALKAYWDN